MFRPVTYRGSFIALVVLMAASASWEQTAKKLKKVYISVDMEGIAGVVTPDQLDPSGFEYERFRRFMTAEALAAVNAAKEGGATEVVVSDSHGNGESLLIDQFPKEVQIVRSWPRHGGMMAGLGSSFQAAIFIGYHASTTNPRGVRAHTFSSAHFARVTLNGKEVSEGEFNAAYAGSLGVPVIFAAGDDAFVDELRGRLGSLETVETKKTLGFHSAETVTQKRPAKGFPTSADSYRTTPRLQALRCQDTGNAGTHVQELHARGNSELLASCDARGFAYDSVCRNRHGGGYRFLGIRGQIQIGYDAVVTADTA